MDRFGLSSWEVDCLQDTGNISDSSTGSSGGTERQESVEIGDGAQRMWILFQSSASSIAQLYKDGIRGDNAWNSFQNAASDVTTLYKGSLDVVRHAVETGIQIGQQKRSTELISWAKRRRRHVRREDLIAHLCGRSPPTSAASTRSRYSPPSAASAHTGYSCRCSPPPSNRHSVTPPSAHSPLPSSAAAHLYHVHHHGSHQHVQQRHVTHAAQAQGHSPPSSAALLTDLQPFRDALLVQGLYGAMANAGSGLGGATVSVRSPGSELAGTESAPTNCSALSTQGPPAACEAAQLSSAVGQGPLAPSAAVQTERDDLNGFILEQLSRHCENQRKRSFQHALDDIVMDSPGRKRSKFF